jgi:hypothetical protein
VLKDCLKRVDTPCACLCWCTDPGQFCVSVQLVSFGCIHAKLGGCIYVWVLCRVLSCPCIHSCQRAPESVFSKVCVSQRVRRGVCCCRFRNLAYTPLLYGWLARVPSRPCAAVWSYCRQLLLWHVIKKGRDGVAVCVLTHLAVSSAHPLRADVAPADCLSPCFVFSPSLGLLPLQPGSLCQGMGVQFGMHTPFGVTMAWGHAVGRLSCRSGGCSLTPESAPAVLHRHPLG